MKIREFLNQNSSIGILAAVVLLVISLFIIFRQISGGGGGQTIDKRYFLDLNTGEIFPADIQAVPPIETPSGPHEGEPAGVAAYVVTCGDCKNSYAGMTPSEVQETGAQIMYLSKYSMEDKQALERARNSEEGIDQAMYTSELIADVSGNRWVSMESRDAMQIMENRLDCPGDQSLKPCYPR